MLQTTFLASSPWVAWRWAIALTITAQIPNRTSTGLMHECPFNNRTPQATASSHNWHHAEKMPYAFTLCKAASKCTCTCAVHACKCIRSFANATFAALHRSNASAQYARVQQIHTSTGWGAFNMYRNFAMHRDSMSTFFVCKRQPARCNAEQCSGATSASALLPAGKWKLSRTWTNGWRCRTGCPCWHNQRTCIFPICLYYCRIRNHA